MGSCSTKAIEPVILILPCITGISPNRLNIKELLPEPILPATAVSDFFVKLRFLTLKKV